ncbi:hypothetical protein OG897_26230 [Streptomyces sp. NBC_00237]|uniref:hypothetical protein n=1 Tax=Streptomyces sp. NBC_00237 TaxID=2975687 RepID=UPI00225B97EC|nr:hypothetical protein [Streptomyces sp. NBC_00237]MCX5204940.1 hypothetical protein [Streptomyces sp. NBC_00237]
MHHHVYRTAAALALVGATALAVTACGGSGAEPSGKSDKIAGADAGKPKAAPSTKADPVAGRPKIVLPEDVRNVFEDGPTGDPAKDAVLADSERRVNSVDAAITIGGKTGEAVTFYSSGDALITATNYITSFYKDGKTFTGTTRFYDREVTSLKGTAAEVTYCLDASKTYPKDRKTQKVSHPAGSPSDYVHYRTGLRKNAKGVWQTVTVQSTEGAKQCMP